MIRLAFLALLPLVASACNNATASGPAASIAWGPQAGSTTLSVVSGAADAFSADVGDAVGRAARAAPKGTSQSSITAAGKTVSEMKVAVVRDTDGNQVYELTDGNTVRGRAPGQRQGFDLALFADVPAGIEPDPSSYPHGLLGVWAWNGQAGAFWDASPPVPSVEFGSASPTGVATYSGDAIGLHTAGSAATKFQADINITADFANNTVSGRATGFKSLDGKPLSALAVTLGKTGFAADGSPFSGDSSAGIEGGGKWGARWSDGAGNAMGGTFGFAAADGSVAVLGAFSAGLRPASGSAASADSAAAAAHTD